MSGLVGRGLRMSYGTVPALTGADFDVAPGTLLALLGPSGCGKTTLLRVVAGFERPDAGTVTVDGELLTGPGRLVPAERRGFGLVPQEGALFPHLSVARNVGFGLPRGRQSQARVAEMLELVGLVGEGDRRPHELSGGQQARVALARALAPRPRLVLLDEPFAALDAGLRSQLRVEVRDLLRAAATTAVLVTHDQEEALSTADRIAVMRDGQVVQHGTPEELYDAPVDLLTARFVGESVELPVTAADGWADTPLGRIQLTAGGGPGTVLIRPEQIRLVARGHHASVSGRVRAWSFHGHDALLEVVVPGCSAPVRVRAAAPLSARPGDDVALVVVGAARFYPTR